MNKFSSFLKEAEELENFKFVDDQDVAQKILYKGPVGHRVQVIPGVSLNRDCSITIRAKSLFIGPINNNILLGGDKYDRLRFRIKSAGAVLQLHALSTLEGLPKTAPRTRLSITSELRLKDFSHIPDKLSNCRITTPNTPFTGGKTEISNSLEIIKCHNGSLKDIEKVFTSAGRLSLTESVTSGFLRIFLIKNTQWLFLNHLTQNPKDFSDKISVEHIINKHLQGERDILDCQEELILNGFKSFATL